MAGQLPSIISQFFDDYGKPLAGGRVYTYESDTTQPKKTYADRDGKAPHSNPIALDASGCAQIFLGEGLYRIRVVDCDETLIYDVSGISRHVDSTELQLIMKTVQDGIDALEQADEAIELTIAEKLEAQKGSAGGFAPLNEVAKIEAQYLPDVVDSLDSESPTDSLSANQGRVLSEKLDEKLKPFQITGEPPAFSCRAWCSFNGLTAEQLAGGNIKSIERTAAGAYTVTFNKPMPSAHYAVTFGDFYGTYEQQNRQTTLKINGQTADQIQIVNVFLAENNGAVLRDSLQLMFAVFC